MREVAYVNGVLSDLEEATISIHDRGFQFGDGVYEVMLSYAGRLWAMERHLQRLEKSLEGLWMAHIGVGQVAEAINRTYEASQIPDALVYIQITRGILVRDYSWPEDLEPTLIITVRHQSPGDPAHQEQGVSVITHPDIRWGRVNIKSLNLLGNVMAKRAARKRGAFEAILVTPDGTMTEGASTSLLIVGQGRLISREDGPHILAGVTRDLVLESAMEAGIPIDRRPFSVTELKSADEVLLTGTTTGVVPVVRVDDRSIGAGRPGAVTSELQRRYQERIATQRDTLLP